MSKLKTSSKNSCAVNSPDLIKAGDVRTSSHLVNLAKIIQEFEYVYNQGSELTVGEEKALEKMFRQVLKNS